MAVTRPLVLVFLPALEEEDAIGDTLARLRVAAAGVEDRMRIETLLVDDGSRDDATERAARAAGVDHVTRHPRRRGLGAATRTGLLHAWRMHADLAVKLDADGQYDPAEVPRAAEMILSEGADVVWGVRARLSYRMPLVRRVGNRVFTRLTALLSGWPVSDAQTGLMAFSRRFLDGFLLGADYNPPQLLLLDGARRGLVYREFPLEAAPRTTGDSFVSWRYPFKVGTNLLRYWWATREF